MTKEQKASIVPTSFRNASCTWSVVQKRDLLTDVRKIAVLRASGLGDFVFALPALESLRNAYPDAEIVLLAKQWHADFLRERPSSVDRVEVIPPYRGVGMPDQVVVRGYEAETEDFFHRMQTEDFDLAIQLHGGGANSNPFLKRLGAKITAGLRAPGAPRLNLEVPYLYFQLEPLRYLEVIALVGGQPVSPEPRLRVIERDLAEVAHALRCVDDQYAVLHPGVARIDRQWPPEKFAQIGDELSAAGLRIVLTGQESERALVRRVQEFMRASSIDLSGRLSTSGLAGLLSGAVVTVSNDTGPLHLAEAVGCPTVGIYWCINMINASPASRTWHRQLVSWQLACSVCGSHQLARPCPHKVSYVAGVPVEDVMEQVTELVERQVHVVSRRDATATEAPLASTL